MGYTVLAIDDTQRILDIVKYFLEQEGYAVKTATDPTQGIELAKSGGIDLILLDIMMPEMDGYAVAEALRKHEDSRDVPIVMLTAEAIIHHTPKDFFYGLYGYLSKPFSREQLLKVVSDTIKLTKEETARRKKKGP